MKQIPIPGWRARLAIEAGLVAIFLTIMFQQDAPAWAITLLLFTATRSSATNVHAGLSYLQQTIRRWREEEQAPTTTIVNVDPKDIEKVIGTGEPAVQQALRRQGVGRWGRDKQP